MGYPTTGYRRAAGYRRASASGFNKSTDVGEGGVGLSNAAAALVGEILPPLGAGNVDVPRSRGTIGPGGYRSRGYVRDPRSRGAPLGSIPAGSVRAAGLSAARRAFGVFDLAQSALQAAQDVGVLVPGSTESEVQNLPPGSCHSVSNRSDPVCGWQRGKRSLSLACPNADPVGFSRDYCPAGLTEQMALSSEWNSSRLLTNDGLRQRIQVWVVVPTGLPQSTYDAVFYGPLPATLAAPVRAPFNQHVVPMAMPIGLPVVAATAPLSGARARPYPAESAEPRGPRAGRPVKEKFAGPPGPGVKEKKGSGSNGAAEAFGAAFSKAIDGITETQDLLVALVEAIPGGSDWLEENPNDPIGTFQFLYANLPQMDWGQALLNILANEVEDQLAGRANKKLRDALRGLGIGHQQII